MTLRIILRHLRTTCAFYNTFLHRQIFQIIQMNLFRSCRSRLASRVTDSGEL